MATIYDKFGIAESYIPKIYFNKITLDKTNHGINLDKSILPYIDEDTAPTQIVKVEAGESGEEGFELELPVDFFAGYKKQTNEPKTLVTAESKIIFNVSNDAEFKKIVEDDDFNQSMEFHYYLFYTKGIPGEDTAIMTEFFNRNPNEEPAVAVTNEDVFIKDVVALNTTNIIHKIKRTSNILNLIVSDQLDNVKTFDIFKKYKKIFPNGATYYELPLTVTFELQKENPQNVYLLAFSKVIDFELDITLNFGQFEINDPDLTIQFSELEGSNPMNNIGPTTFETVVRHANAQSFGAVFTISDDQATPITPETEDPVTEEENNTARELAFNDLKGTPWFGGVHSHSGRFMAGDVHVAELHPYLDINYVANTKVMDLRPIKKIKDAIVDFSPLVDILNVSDIDYLVSNNSIKPTYENITTISDPLLSVKKDGDIDGFFAVDYIKFLRRYGLIPGLLEHLANTELAPSFGEMLTSQLKISLRDSLDIRIDRIGPQETKTIYDSNFADAEGKYPQFGISNGVDGKEFTEGARLGYLNVLNMSRATFTNVSDISLVEFYNFTDLDPTKQFDVEYRYKVFLSFNDPLYDILIQMLIQLDNAINGTGKQLGLKQLISMASVMTKNINILNESGSPYIKGNFIDLQVDEVHEDVIGGKIAPVKTLLEVVQDYDIRNGVDSLAAPGVGVLKDVGNLLINSSTLPILLNSQKTGVRILPADLADMMLATNFTKEEDVSIDGMTLVLNTIESIHQDLSNIIDGLSNANAPKTDALTTQSAANTTSPGNANSDLRVISHERTSSTYIKRTDFGFDYTDMFFRGPDDDAFVPLQQLRAGLKQVTGPRYINRIISILQDYYSISTITKDELATVATVSDNGFTYLPLYPDGINLPSHLIPPNDKLKKQSWEAILQSLMLFKGDKLSKITSKNIFKTAQESIGGIIQSTKFSKKESPESLDALKMAERNQSLIVDKGLSIQDREIVQTSQEYTPSDSPLGQGIPIYKSTKISHTDVTTNNFLSYLNNLSEGVETAPLSEEVLSSFPPDSSLQSLVLLFYKTTLLQSGVSTTPDAFSSDFETIYNSIFHNPSNQIYLARYAEYLFRFLHGVKIEYLDNFETYDLTQETNVSLLASKDNWDLNSHIWRNLSLSAIDKVDLGNALLCRVTQYNTPALPSDDINDELKFFPLFYKYFLIIGGNTETLTIKEFGSTV